MAWAIWCRKARIVAVATRCMTAWSSAAPAVPRGGRYVPASVSMVECSPAGASVMSASRAGNSASPGPATSHRSANLAESPMAFRFWTRTWTTLDSPGTEPSGPTRARPVISPL